MPDIVEKIPQGQSQRLNASQRALVATKLTPFYESKARDAAGKAAGVNGKYIDIARKVKEASPEVASQVLNGKMTLQEGLKQVAPIIAAAVFWDLETET
jgi:hypothetical protein